MESPSQKSLLETWGNREYIERWTARNEWQRPIRDMQLIAVDLMVPHAPEAPIRILDLAAGYGALTAALLKDRPHATAVCLDVSEEMIKMGRESMAHFGQRVEFVQGSLEDPGWLKCVSGTFDAAVSARALHHFSANQRRRILYREIYQILGPGGCFINADNMRASTDSLKTRYREACQRLMGGYVQEKTGGQKTLEEVQAATTAPSHSRHDNGFLDQELVWLRETGFDEVDCFWKFATYAVYGGFRPAG
ncbi:MAG: class I SAM-dependent methyltransferase [Deltaproteobacteria bacterium]|nr:class I SAM-dependent methyltransferase [Deltaproteobacteria bacterium]